MPPSTSDLTDESSGYVTTYYPGTDATGEPTQGHRRRGGSHRDQLLAATAADGGRERNACRDSGGHAAGGIWRHGRPGACGTGQRQPGDRSRRVPIDRDGHFQFHRCPVRRRIVLNFTSSGGWAHETRHGECGDRRRSPSRLQAPLRVKGRVEFLGDTPAPTGAALEAVSHSPGAGGAVPGARIVRSRDLRQAASSRSWASPPAATACSPCTTPPWTEMSGTLGGARHARHARRRDRPTATTPSSCSSIVKPACPARCASRRRALGTR